MPKAPQASMDKENLSAVVEKYTFWSVIFGCIISVKPVMHRIRAPMIPIAFLFVALILNEVGVRWD